MKIIEINFANNLLVEIEIKDNKIKVLKAMDGWGNPIKIDEISIVEGEKE